MAGKLFSRGFVGRRREPEAAKANRIPPGQYLTTDFPVLSAGPTPRTSLARWTFSIEGLVKEPVKWSWEKFLKLPAQTFVVDISCVTKWTKLDTKWKGASVDTLLEHTDVDAKAQFVIAFAEQGYTTNIPLPDLVNGRAFVAHEYDDQPLAPEHGGPARLVVPLMAMIRHRAAERSQVPTRLLFSSRTPDDAIYYAELEKLSAGRDGLEVFHTFTRV